MSSASWWRRSKFSRTRSWRSRGHSSDSREQQPQEFDQSHSITSYWRLAGVNGPAPSDLDHRARLIDDCQLLALLALLARGVLPPHSRVTPFVSNPGRCESGRGFDLLELAEKGRDGEGEFPGRLDLAGVPDAR